MFVKIEILNLKLDEILKIIPNLGNHMINLQQEVLDKKKYKYASAVPNHSKNM